MTEFKGASYDAPAIRVLQDDMALFVTAVPARVVAELGVVDEYDPEKDLADPAQGYQRAPLHAHAAKIKSYLLDPTHRRLMPSATLLSSRTPVSFRPSGADGTGIVTITKPLYIVDGQHRSLGFTLAAEEDESIGEFPVPVIIIQVDEKAEEVRQFYTINKTAKGVKADLAEVLLKQLGDLENPAKRWRSIAIEIAKTLNNVDGGPWKDRITLPNAPGKMVSQKSMTESLKPVLTSALFGVDGNIVTAALNNFWEALRSLMPEAFENPKNYVLQKSNGVFVWNEVANEHFRRQMILDKDLGKGRALNVLKGLGEYVEHQFWANKKHGGTAPNYGGRAGMQTLALEIISAMPAQATPDGAGIKL